MQYIEEYRLLWRHQRLSDNTNSEMFAHTLPSHQNYIGPSPEKNGSETQMQDFIYACLPSISEHFCSTQMCSAWFRFTYRMFRQLFFFCAQVCAFKFNLIACIVATAMTLIRHAGKVVCMCFLLNWKRLYMMLLCKFKRTTTIIQTAWTEHRLIRANVHKQCCCCVCILACKYTCIYSHKCTFYNTSRRL